MIGTVLALVDTVVGGGLNERHPISRFPLPIHLKRMKQAIAMGRLKNIDMHYTYRMAYKGWFLGLVKFLQNLRDED